MTVQKEQLPYAEMESFIESKQKITYRKNTPEHH